MPDGTNLSSTRPSSIRSSLGRTMKEIRTVMVVAPFEKDTVFLLLLILFIYYAITNSAVMKNRYRNTGGVDDNNIIISSYILCLQTHDADENVGNAIIIFLHFIKILT